MGGGFAGKSSNGGLTLNNLFLKKSLIFKLFGGIQIGFCLCIVSAGLPGSLHPHG